MSEASEGARAMGRIKTAKKARSSAANLAAARERLADPDVQAEANRKRSEAQKARWQRVRDEKKRLEADKRGETSGDRGAEGAQASRLLASSDPVDSSPRLSLLASAEPSVSTVASRRAKRRGKGDGGALAEQQGR